MKRCFWVWYLFVSVNCIAQNRGNIWMLAYQPFVKDCGIDFNSGIADTFSVWKNLEFFSTNASICDTNGNLLFYTNGVFIANKNHDTLQNSMGFNPGWATDFYGSAGLGLTQAVLILPQPESNHKYIVIHGSADIADSSNAQPLYLKYSSINMDLDNGLGGIEIDKKGIVFLSDTLVIGRITACKHANGIDWWIITHKWNSDLYFKFLLKSDTILGPYEQHIGSFIIKNDAVGQACFSSDGTKFAYMNRNFNFDFMVFDRCSGEFSNPVNVLLPDSNLSLGIAFSPNNRFIYAVTLNKLLQYDTWSPDFQSAVILIDTIPVQGSEDGFGPPMLAPDNKIYISTYHSKKALHIINYPDSLGTSCGFSKLGFQLPMYNVYSVPNHPNYDLAESPGNDTCEVIYTSAPKPSKNETTYRIAPNPVSDWLNIIYQSNEDALFELFDLYGKRVEAISLFHYFKNRLLNVSELQPGVYLAAVSCKGERIWSEKLVVQR